MKLVVALLLLVSSAAAFAPAASRMALSRVGGASSTTPLHLVPESAPRAQAMVMNAEGEHETLYEMVRA